MILDLFDTWLLKSEYKTTNLGYYINKHNKEFTYSEVWQKFILDINY